MYEIFDDFVFEVGRLILELLNLILLFSKKCKQFDILLFERFFGFLIGFLQNFDGFFEHLVLVHNFIDAQRRRDDYVIALTFFYNFDWLTRYFIQLFCEGLFLSF
jgi:hypothetical protein